MIVIAGEPEAELIVRAIKQLAARSKIVLIVDVFAAGDVVKRAVAQRPRNRKPAGQNSADERSGNRRLDLPKTVIAGRHFRFDLAFESGWPDHDVDRASRGVLTEQCPLRTAQHLDPFDIYEIERRGGRAAHIDLIDVEADAGLETVIDRKSTRLNSSHTVISY